MFDLRHKICASILAVGILLTGTVYSQLQASEELEYKKFKLEKATCDTAVLYRQTAKGVDIGVSAIATGMGAEFRKWDIADVKLHIDDDICPPDRTDKFYVRKESFFRIPAAVLFAALGTQIDVGGTTLEKGIAKAGAAIGLGLLVLQAHGEITGQRYVFHLDKALAEKAFGGKSFIQIRLEDPDQHWEDTVKIGIAKPAFKSDNKDIYSKMSSSELAKVIDDLGDRVRDMEKEQAAYKYGVNPEYDQMESEIEDLQAQRGIAYRIWFEKSRVDNNEEGPNR